MKLLYYIIHKLNVFINEWHGKSKLIQFFNNKMKYFIIISMVTNSNSIVITILLEKLYTNVQLK